jgi:hypothetical protein
MRNTERLKSESNELYLLPEIQPIFLMMKYLRNSKTISGRLHDEMVMMDMEQGKYFSLNQTATVIWELLETPLTMEELCDRLMDEYDVDREQCLEEVKEYIEEMKGLGLVKGMK